MKLFEKLKANKSVVTDNLAKALKLKTFLDQYKTKRKALF